MPKNIILDKHIGGLNILESYKPNSSSTGPVLGSFTVDGVVVENRISQNGTYYESALWEQPTTFGIGGKFFDESGKLKPAKLMGTLDHPSDGTPEVRFENSAIAWRDIRKGKDGNWIGEADILNTPAGKIVKTHLDYAKLVGGGEAFGASLRGLGDSESVNTTTESYNRIIPETFELMSIDFVYDPSFQNVAVLTENKKHTNRLLVESIQRLAKEDQEHAPIYEAYANSLSTKTNTKGVTKMENTQHYNSVIIKKSKLAYLKTLKYEVHKLRNSVFKMEELSPEEFEKKFPKIDRVKYLKAAKLEERELSLAIEKLEEELAQTFSEASSKELDSDIEEFLASQSYKDDEELEGELDEEGNPIVNEDPAEEDLAEGDPDSVEVELDEDGNPIVDEVDIEVEVEGEVTLERVSEMLKELTSTINELKEEIELLTASVEPFEDVGDLELTDDLEQEPDVEQPEEDTEEDEGTEDDDLEELDEDALDISEEDLESLSDEELKYLEAQLK